MCRRKNEVINADCFDHTGEEGGISTPNLCNNRDYQVRKSPGNTPEDSEMKGGPYGKWGKNDGTPKAADSVLQIRRSLHSGLDYYR